MRILHIAFLLVVVMTFAAFAACGGGSPAATPTATPIPTLEITGPATLVHNVAGTFTVIYNRTGNPLGTDRTHKIHIDEDDTSDDRLIADMDLVVPAGAMQGTANFALTCTYDGANWDLVGANGASQDENPHQIHAERFVSGGINDASANWTVTCNGAAGKPKKLTVVDRYGQASSVLVNNRPEVYTVKLEMTDSVAAEEKFEVRIDEDDNIDDTLVKKVEITVPAGAKEGIGTFTLTCTSDGTSWDLTGADGTSQDENVHWVHAEGASAPASDNHIIRCRQPTEGELEETPTPTPTP